MGDDSESIEMAACGACSTLVPVDSSECPSCGVSFRGISDEVLGECGSCGALVPLDSTSCPSCSVRFVADDVVSVLSEWMGRNNMSVEGLFSKFDDNGDGVIESSELKQGLLDLKLADLPPSEVERLVTIIDEDGNGVIDLEELQAVFDSEDGSDEPSDDSSIAVDSDGAMEDTVAEPDSEVPEPTPSEDPGDEDPDQEEEEEPAASSEDGTELEEAVASEKEDEDQPLEEITESEDDMESQVIADADEESDEPSDVTTNTDAATDASSTEPSNDNPFPSPMQRRMMAKSWTDVVSPLIGFTFFLVLMGFVVNAVVGPVDGTGGTIVWEGTQDLIVDGASVAPGESYECVEGARAILPAEDDLISTCANSFTLTSSDLSMPKGWYLDGLLGAGLSIVGLIGTAYVHLVIIPGWRNKARALKRASLEGDAGEDEGSTEDEPMPVDDIVSEEPSGEEVSAPVDEPESNEDEASEEVDLEMDEAFDEEELDEDVEEEDDDAVDIGSRIGLDLGDGEELFGTIVEFNDDEGTVVITDEETGEEVEAPQDMMFVV